MNVFDTISSEDLLRYGIAFVVVSTVLLAMAYVMWGGFLMIISGGNEEKVKGAINHIRHAVSGVIILIIILFAMPLLVKLMGFSYGEYLTPQAIIESMSEISSRFFGNNVSSDMSLPDTHTTLPSDFSNL